MCHVSIFRWLGCQEPYQEDPYPPSPGWILGGQLVPDALSGSRQCPEGALFDIKVSWNHMENILELSIKMVVVVIIMVGVGVLEVVVVVVTNDMKMSVEVISTWT